MEEAPIGYACQKIICDEHGEPYDYEFIDVNSSFADCVFMRDTKLPGHRFSELFPQIFRDNPEWIRIVGEIAVNGGQREIEHYSDIFRKWMRMKVFSPEKKKKLFCHLT